MKFVNQHKFGSPAVLVGVVLILSGCASTSSNNQISELDPYENFNRPVYHFNNKVDSAVLKPMADAYKVVTPDFMEKGVSNFFNNLEDINVVLNDILQAKFKQGAQDLGRFTLNTTLGFLGVIDVASDAGLDKHKEDFGQTLAVWGVPQGSYLVLPFLGPSTFREIPGYVVDAAANPATYLGFSVPLVSLAGVGALNARANAEGSLKFINEAAMDPYVFTREAFLQWRRHEASDGKVDTTKEMESLEADLMEDDLSEKPVQKKVDESGKSPLQQSKSESELENEKIVSEPEPHSYDDAKRLFDEADMKLKSLQQKRLNQVK